MQFNKEKSIPDCKNIWYHLSSEKFIFEGSTDYMDFLYLLTAFLVSVSVPTAGEENDYGFTNSDWNGLTSFIEDARAQGLRSRVLTTIDFDDIDTKTALMILYPTTRPPSRDLVSFAAAGGIVILADDFGKSDSFLEAVGIKRVKAGKLSLHDLYRNSPAHPIALPEDKIHPLSIGTERLVLNHPAFFVSGHKAVFSAGGRDRGVVISIPTGYGRLILISDPSLFINLMQRFDCNRKFALNLLRKLLKNEISDLLVTSHNFEVKGSYLSETETGSLPGMPANPVVLIFSKIRDLLNAWTDYKLLPGIIIPFSVILCGVILVFLAGRMPVRSISYDGGWTSAGERPTPGRFYAGMKKYASGASRDFLEPACLLRDQIDRELESRLRTHSPMTLLRAKKVMEILQKEHSAEAAGLYRKLYAEAHRLPATERLAEKVPRRRFPLRRLRKIDMLAGRLLDMLDARTIS